MNGKVEALWIKRAHRSVMDPAEHVTLVEGKGIDTDANFGRSKRQVSVIEKEVLDRIIAELPDVEPHMRRANVMVSGIRLENTRGHILTLGETKIRLCGETRPCERMDAQVQGFTAALDPNWNGGAFGVVLTDGHVRVGDEASIEAPTAASD
ncbi:MAG: MOSC domain-containing protein [Longimicrobiales bacterium]|jgi:MOSC domain-containing protein YiiM|nr:MOSC domain-containing protein [Longimicrobiales bacterium]